MAQLSVKGLVRTYISYTVLKLLFCFFMSLFIRNVFDWHTKNFWILGHIINSLFNYLNFILYFCFTYRVPNQKMYIYKKVQHTQHTQHTRVTVKQKGTHTTLLQIPRARSKNLDKIKYVHNLSYVTLLYFWYYSSVLVIVIIIVFTVVIAVHNWLLNIIIMA